jgi:hypothetical protein
MPVIFGAGLIAGTLDIIAAFVVYSFFGAKPIPLLQGIAAGLLGPEARNGGIGTAALGLVCHFFIAFLAAAVYFVLSRQVPAARRHVVISGAFYGVIVYFVMNRIVVPLSAARKFPFSWKMMFIGLAIHIVCVGIPIAVATRRFSAA